MAMARHRVQPGPAGSSLSLHGLKELQRCRPVVRWQAADGRAEAHRVGGKRRPGGFNAGWVQVVNPGKGWKNMKKAFDIYFNHLRI